jgi:hypothetical protein
MWFGTYCLDLYCDNSGPARDGATMENYDGIHAFQEFPKQYTGEHGSACRAQARKDGWIIRGDGSAICPKCSGKTRK